MKIIIFDFDGVIVDSAERNRKIYNEHFHGKYGLKRAETHEEFVNLFTKNFYDVLRQEGMSDQEILQSDDEWHLRQEYHENNAAVFAGIQQAIHVLSQNAKLFIISSNITEAIKRKLKQENINHFSEVFGGDLHQSKAEKIDHLKQDYPESQFYFIGDTVSDIAEGNQAGVVTIAATWGYHSERLLSSAKPTHLAHSPQELLELFTKHNI